MGVSVIQGSCHSSCHRGFGLWGSCSTTGIQQAFSLPDETQRVECEKDRVSENIRGTAALYAYFDAF